MLTGEEDGANPLAVFVPEDPAHKHEEGQHGERMQDHVHPPLPGPLTLLTPPAPRLIESSVLTLGKLLPPYLSLDFFLELVILLAHAAHLSNQAGPASSSTTARGAWWLLW